MLLMAALCHAEELKEFDLVAASVADDRAVFKRSGAAELILLKSGDALPGSGAVVRQILADRVLLEAQSEAAAKNPDPKSYFLFRAQPGKRSRLEPLLAEEQEQATPRLPAPDKVGSAKKPSGKAAKPAMKKNKPQKSAGKSLSPKKK